MKRYMMVLVMALFTAVCANAMGYNEARREALYLTDKMAYELNLNAAQYDYVYEINLDYLLGLDRPNDVVGIYYRHRCADLRDVLHDWQYSLFLAADYFLHPVTWHRTGWYFPIYRHYVRDHFFYACPHVYHTYVGGHTRNHHHSGFYAGRRPHWSSGMRGPHRDKIVHNQGNGHHGNGVRSGRADSGFGNERPPVRKDNGIVNRGSGRGNQYDSGRGGRGTYTKTVSLDDSGNNRVARPVTPTPTVRSTGRSGRNTSSAGRVHTGSADFKNSSTRTTVNRPSPSTSRGRAVGNVQAGSRKSVSTSQNGKSGPNVSKGRGGR